MKRWLPNSTGGADAAPRLRPSFPVKLEPGALPGVRKVSPQRNDPVATSAAGAGAADSDGQAARAAMVSKLQAQGVSNPMVLAALGAVQRHRFVDSALANQAYEDTSLPIGQEQTISKPSVVARMLELLCQGRTQRLGRVLEIGTGCGYQAALLSHLSTEVYSMERLRGLHQRARENLRGHRLPNVHLLLGDGTQGYASGAPYAAIIAAAGASHVPDAWLEQLAVGGRLVTPAQVKAGEQGLLVIDKTPTGLERNFLEPVRFVPLKSGIA